MGFGVFIHRSDSQYGDLPVSHYQFPKQYLSRAQKCIGSYIVYYEPVSVKNSRGYFAVAKVQKIVEDPIEEDMFLAIIQPNSYLEFGESVPFRLNSKLVELGLLDQSGGISGRAQSAVRPISNEDFNRIIELGLNSANDILPREDDVLNEEEFHEITPSFEHQVDRARIEQLVSRPVRDRNFRKAVVRAYDATCALTGIKLINGGGRAEVQAAHIKPVEHNGPDITCNGLALSGTAHWMFDRGLVGLSENLEILISRQSNDRASIEKIINPTGRLIEPSRAFERPHKDFVAWHRENCFKQ